MVTLFRAERRDRLMALVLVLLAVFAATAAIAQPSRPGGVTNSQWAAYTGDLPRTWHGLFSRYGSNAELVVETRASSMYVVADQGREVRRKNVYSNREFFNITESVLVQRQENLAGRTQPVILKDGNSFFNVRGPDAAKFLFFMVIMHPLIAAYVTHSFRCSNKGNSIASRYSAMSMYSAAERGTSGNSGGGQRR